MKIFRNAALAALTMSCAITFGAPAAHSATLLDFLRGNKVSKQKDTFAGSLDDDVGAFPDPARPSKPLPRVSSPKYFTYKADGLKWIDVSRFSPRLQTAAADPQQTGSIETVSTTPHVDITGNPRAYMMDVRAKAPTEVAAAIEKFYASREGLLWVDADGVSEKARQALDALRTADAVGLDPADYAVEDPTDTFAAVDAVTRQRQLMQFEVELTAALLTYVQDAQRGRIDPNRISEYHDFKRKAVNLPGALLNIAATTDIKSYLESRSPSNKEFETLRRELAALKASEGTADTRIEIAPGTLLKPGESNAELANIIAAVRQRGSDTLKLDHSVTLASYQGEPDYTPELVDVVKAFQAENGLKGDGIVGKGTIRILTGGDTGASRINKIVIAMEQMRWLPNNLGPRYIFINQPAFTAYYHNNDHEEFNMKVVVGSKANQTYFFQDDIELVEYNPYWGVPRSIIVNEMLPKLRADPSYLDRLGYETSISGQQVSSTSIDWDQTDSVDVRQPPGNGNALGQLKIMFPNTHAIYMHDTPQKKFFQRDMRALSHGCVRLVDPKKMAAAVMNMSVEDIDAQIATGQNRQVKVPQRFPVYVAYFTAYPNKDGVVEYFDDVYDRDMYMNRALDATKKARHGTS
ncbi:L,D-transpeptidase family protein [Rhizobium sp. KVB221]|uniref:L,D-transpeptidase family protein n=1 Tax=Rhizobium setariae TaxID=2801340 RepID=A0A936YM72_9HYPH|nr:L,D-transpeptidase family protein [Rhizobium setariae]MBL0373079.1 L,D-transpeptidase family protein [Rhizobium setariae]